MHSDLNDQNSFHSTIDKSQGMSEGVGGGGGGAHCTEMEFALSLVLGPGASLVCI